MSYERIWNVLGLALFVSYFSASDATSQTFIPLFTEPNCATKDYIVEVKDVVGDDLEGPPGGLYCDETDFPDWDFAESAFAELLDELFSERRITNVYMSDYFYTDVSFATWLCERLIGTEARVLTYYQSSANTYAHISRAFADTLSQCHERVEFRKIGCDVFKNPEVCAPGLNILHAKVKLFELDDGTFVSFSGSGNTNKSFYANLEDWQVINGEINSSQGIRFYCLFDALSETAGLTYTPVGFFDRLNKQCLSTRNVVSANSLGDIGIGILPSDSTWFRGRVVSSLEDASRIYIVAQFFDDPEFLLPITEKIRNVEMIMDDDWYWALEGAQASSIVSILDVEAFQKHYDEGTLDISFLLTNHHEESRMKNTNHLRYVITEKSDGELEVFTGGAHYKKGSLELNYEAQFVISDQEIAEQYLTHFHRLKLRAVGPSQMPAFDAPAQ